MKKIHFPALPNKGNELIMELKNRAKKPYLICIDRLFATDDVDASPSTVFELLQDVPWLFLPSLVQQLQVKCVF